MTMSMGVPVPDEGALVLGDSFAGRMAAITDPGAAASGGQPQPYGTDLPAAAGDISRIVDLKGLARPEKFDGLDTSWLEWKSNFRSIMNLLDVTPYLDKIEEMTDVEIDMARCTVREQFLSRLLFTILTSVFTTGRARSVCRLAPNARTGSKGGGAYW